MMTEDRLPPASLASLIATIDLIAAPIATTPVAVALRTPDLERLRADVPSTPATPLEALTGIRLATDDSLAAGTYEVTYGDGHREVKRWPVDSRIAKGCTHPADEPCVR